MLPHNNKNTEYWRDNKIDYNYTRNSLSQNYEMTRMKINKDNKKDVFISNIIDHPFIKQLKYDEYLTYNKSIYIVHFKLNEFGGKYFIELILNENNNFIKIKSDKTVSEICKHSNIIGTKRYKGHLYFNNDLYLINQVKNDKIKGVLLHDLLINEHVFGKEVHENVKKFIGKYYEIYYLYKNYELLEIPIVKYSYADKKYFKFINIYKTIQYCNENGEYLIEVRNYQDGDSVRHICWMGNYKELVERNYLTNELDCVMIKENGVNKWIFKNKKNVYSIIK